MTTFFIITISVIVFVGCCAWIRSHIQKPGNEFSSCRLPPSIGDIRYPPNIDRLGSYYIQVFCRAQDKFSEDMGKKIEPDWYYVRAQWWKMDTTAYPLGGSVHFSLTKDNNYAFSTYAYDIQIRREITQKIKNLVRNGEPLPVYNP